MEGGVNVATTGMASSGPSSSPISRACRGFAVRAVACGAVVALAAGCGGGGGKPKAPQVSHTPGAWTSPTAGGTAGGATTGDTTGTPALAGGVTPIYPAWNTPVPAFAPKNVAKDLDSWTAP